MKMDFIVIGAAKCGTTALHDMLKKMPSVQLPEKKDFHYFDYDENYIQGEGWYLSHFLSERPESKRGEVAANYLYSTKALRRIQKDFGKSVKIIVIVRDPVERLISEYEHHRRNGTLREELGYYLKTQNAPPENNRHRPWHLLVERSQYSRWLTDVKKLFDDVLVLNSEDLKRNHDLVLKEICSFIGAEYHFVPSAQSNNKYTPRSELISRVIGGGFFGKRLLRLAVPSYLLRQKLRSFLKKLNSSRKDKAFYRQADIDAARNILSDEKKKFYEKFY